MRKFAYFLFLYLAWVFLVWPFSPLDLESLSVGVIVAIFLSLIFGDIFVRHPEKMFNLKRYFWFIAYLPVFFYYCLLANFDVVYRVLHPKMPINPGIVKVKTSLKSQTAITALANSITLTPGTLTVDLTEDGYLYIHWINVKTEDIEEASRIIVQKFERFLRRIFE